MGNVRSHYFANSTEEYDLNHYGVKRRSGRYPWGSGEDPYQHGEDFLGRIDLLKKKGMSEVDIAKSFGLTTTQYRVQKSLASNERRALQVKTAKRLREKEGKSLNEIAEIMGFKNDSSVRALLNENTAKRKEASLEIAKQLKDIVDKKGMLDVGSGVEIQLGISKEKLNEALYILKLQGYETYGGGVPQVTNPGKQTNIKVLTPPGTEHKDIYDYKNINSLNGEIHSEDGGKTFHKLEYPAALDPSRVLIRYAEEGGIEKDGLIEVRKSCPDLSLGSSRYAQVRIRVDGLNLGPDKDGNVKDRYMKGMCIGKDDRDIPKGYDVVFNTNKKKGTPMQDVLKPIKDDPDNPFGALIKANGQSHYIGKDGKKHLSVINKKSEEGDWDEWADGLSSQFLSKQSRPLIKKQLALTKADKLAEFEEICALTNPTVKKALLKSFADDCDASAVHLKAASLPRQRYHVILPVPTLKDDEVYAPNYKNGEKIALVRFPHAGTFEIPILTVNNRHPDAKKLLGNALDAVGINANVAGRLSGADFDGDTVMAIPTGGKIKITSTKPLAGLVGFEPKDAYPYVPGMRIMKNTQIEMGKISNLITDMTLQGAPMDEIERAVKHSMVVIDAEKHKLNYKQSELDNGIAELKKKWQGSYDENGRFHTGAGTLISRAKGKATPLKTKGQPWINPKTGAYEWERINPETGEKESKYVHETYIDKNGKTQFRTKNSTKMAETSDARTLSSGHPVEELYADYANYMKALGNKARLTMINTGKIAYSSEAKAKYSEEVKSLKSKLKVSLLNAPKERSAQVLANAEVKAKLADNPNMDKKDIKKLKTVALNDARIKVGAKRQPIVLTDKEWEAIQAGAISENTLTKIIAHTDTDSLRSKATPRNNKVLTEGKIAKLKAMNDSGYTNTEIAEALGVSTSTIIKYIKEGRDK